MLPRKARSRGAPRAKASEWIGGRLRSPWFIEDRDEPYRAELVLWLEWPSGLVVGQQVLAPEQVEGALGRALEAALARPLAGPPRRPDAIRVADPVLAAEVRAVLGDAVPITLAPTPELDELLDQMLEAMPESGVEPSYLEGGRIRPEAVARLFSAAELLYRVAPWKVASEEQVLRMDIPALGVEGACVSIIGELGESLGVLVFPSLTAYDAFCSVAETALAETRPRDLGTGWLALEFVRGADLPASLRHEVASHGWPVAGPKAYPLVVERERDGTPRPIAEREVAIAAACATSLAAFFVKHPRLFEDEDFEPVCESWFDGDDLEVRFTAPYEAFDLFEIERPAASVVAPARGEAPAQSRNAPCPCGSGRKYKKCCLPGAEERRPSQHARHPLHELDDRLVHALLEFAGRRFGPAWLRAEAFGADTPSVLQIAVPWSLYHHRHEEQTVLDHYLAERRRRLSPAERGWLESQRAAWLSVWEVTDVEPGVSMTLRDLLTGETRSVHEKTASRTAVRRDAVLGRVVDHQGVSLICGMHPRVLAPSAAAEVVRRARVRARRKGVLPLERLRDEGFGRALIRYWKEAVEESSARAALPPDLQNTDGDPFLLTTDHFEIAPGARASVEATLAALPEVEPPGPGEGPPAYVFLRAGNRIHKSWDNTVVGRAWISGDELHAETNSRERADTLRERLESVCGTGIRHRAREHADPLSERARPARPRATPERPPPEAEQLLLEFKQRHYDDWLDTPVPALGGKTPREAARTARGRSAVDVLLKDMEVHEQRAGGGFDFSALRRELRLDGGEES
jgi:hypothetical protein